MIRWVFVLLLLISTSTLRAAPSFDPGTLGHMKGVLDVCGRVVPQKASQYLLQIKAVIGDASKNEVEQAMKSDEYQLEYQSIHNEVNGLTRQGLVKTCDDYLSTN